MERGSEDGGWRTDEIQAVGRQRQRAGFFFVLFLLLFSVVSSSFTPGSDVPPTTLTRALQLLPTFTHFIRFW